MTGLGHNTIDILDRETQFPDSFVYALDQLNNNINDIVVTFILGFT